VKVSKRLELRAGFRTESTNGWNEAEGRAANYAIVNGVLQTQTAHRLVRAHHQSRSLAARAACGLCMGRVGQWEKTAVRGGFGLYHGLLDTLDYRLDQTAPFNTAESISNIAVSKLNITAGTPPPAGAKISPATCNPTSLPPQC